MTDEEPVIDTEVVEEDHSAMAYQWQMLLVSLLAFAIENDEPYNVDMNIVQDILGKMVSENLTPQLAFGQDGDRLKYGCVLVPDEDVEDKE